MSEIKQTAEEMFEQVWNKANDGRDFIHTRAEDAAKRNAFRYFLAAHAAQQRVIDEHAADIIKLHDIAGSYSMHINSLYAELGKYKTALQHIVDKDENCFATTTAKEALMAGEER